MPTRPVRAGFPPTRDGFGNRQVLRRRDFDVRGLTFDDADGVAGLLGEGGFVGRVARERQRVAQHVAPERLRRLGEKDGPSIERRADDVALRPA